MRLTEFISDWAILVEGYKEAQAEFEIESDAETAKEIIAKYKELVNRNQAQGEQRNIDYWRKQGWPKFKEFVDTVAATPTPTQIKKKQAVGKSITLQENDDWLIVIPLDKEASCFHGKDSSWCTTKLQSGYFEDYFYERDVILIYCLSKKTADMWAIAGYQDSKLLELFDKEDKPMSAPAFRDATGLDPRELFKIAFKQHGSTIETSKEEYNDHITLLSVKIPKITERDAETEKSLLFTKNAVYTHRYIDQLLANNQSVEQLPEALIRVAVNSKIEYLGYFPNASKKVLEDAVKFSSSALRFIKNPTPEIIELAVQTHVLAIRFVKDPELVQKLVHTYPKAAAYYATTGDHKRIPDMESKIAKDVQALEAYLQLVQERWPEAEPTILTNSRLITRYVKNNLKREPWPEAEAALLEKNDAFGMYMYAGATRKRFRAAEPTIMTNGAAAANYAIDVMQDDWPDAEPYIMELDPANDNAGVLYANKFDWGEYKEEWPDYFDDYEEEEDDDY